MNAPDFIIYLVRGGFILKRRIGSAWPLIEWHDTRNTAEARITELAPFGASVLVRWLDERCEWKAVPL
jgi:hypothetical protein